MCCGRASNIIEVKGKLKERKFENKLTKDSSLVSGKYYIRINNEEFEKENSDIIERKLENSGNLIYITKKIDCYTMRKTAEKYIKEGIFYARFED